MDKRGEAVLRSARHQSQRGDTVQRPDGREVPEELLASVRNATDELEELLAAGRVDEAAVVQRRISRLLGQARRATKTRVPSEALNVAETAGSSTAGMSTRDVIMQAMMELDAVVDGRLLSDYAAARFSTPVDPSALSSMRRDERKAYDRGTTTGRSLLTPALDAGRFVPVRGKNTLSSWPLWRRLLGPRSGRVELLRATSSIIEQLRWLRTLPDPEPARALRRVAVKLASSLPGADPTLTGDDALDHVLAVARHELSKLNDDDEALRRDAARRAEDQLDADMQVWGADKLLAVKEG